MKTKVKISCILVMLLSVSYSYAQSGFRFGVDVHGGMGFEEEGPLTKPQASASLVGGYQFNPHLFLGLGIGMGHFSPLSEEKALYPGGRIDFGYEYAEKNMLQLFFREKVNFLDRKVSPFTTFDIGCPVSRKRGSGDSMPLFLEPGLGCDLHIGNGHALSLMVGYHWQGVSYNQSRYNINDQLYSIPLQKIAGQLTLHVGFMF